MCAFNSLPLSNHGGLVSFSLFLPCTTAYLIRSLWRTLNTAGAYLGWTHRWVIDWYSYFLHVHTVTMKHCGCSHKENWGTSQDFNPRVLMCCHLDSHCTITSACVCLHHSTHVPLPQHTCLIASGYRAECTAREPQEHLCFRLKRLASPSCV